MLNLGPVQLHLSGISERAYSTKKPPAIAGGFFMPFSHYRLGAITCKKILMKPFLNKLFQFLYKRIFIAPAICMF